MVRLLAAVARGRVDGVVRRSTTRDSTPWRASAVAAVSPPGPAPTTRTGTCVGPADVGMHLGVHRHLRCFDHFIEHPVFHET